MTGPSRITRYACIAALTFGSLATPGLAFAADSGDDPGKLAAAPVVQTEGSSSWAVNQPTRPGMITPLDSSGGANNATLSGSGSVAITPPGGKKANLSAGFTSKATWSNLDTKVVISGGSSYGRWYGSTPYNANKLTLTDKIWVSSLTNVSIGYPGGISATVGGKDIKLTSSVSNNWKIDHGFSGISFTGPLFNVAENVSLTAKFSTSTYFYTFD